MRRLLLALALLAAAAGPALAVKSDEVLADPGLESRARGLSSQLRCMVCQNQSIDESDASLARDLRMIVRERVAAGDGDRAVLDFLVARYGDFVLLKPPFKPETWLLWGTPILVLLGAGLAIAASAGRARTSEAPEPLAEGEALRVATLTGDTLPKLHTPERRV